MSNNHFLESFYIDRHQDVSHTAEHYVNVAIYFTFGFWLLYMGNRKWSKEKGRKIILYLCLGIFLLQILKSSIRFLIGNFDIAKDLPLHVCNLVPLLMYITYSIRSRALFGIFFFWIMCGTLQANVTPTLWDAFPHYESIRYWATHALMPFAAVFGLVALKWKLEYKDVIRSWLLMTVGSYLMYLVNNTLGSNYWFVNRKPDAATIYDLLGPWPEYMYQLFVIALILFSAMYFIVKGIEWLVQKIKYD
jgi:hypothetical integral membrane protein (TIGR02206 family)